MGSNNPLENWHFLIGTWKGELKDQFGGEGVIEVTSTFSLELNNRFIMNRSEVYREGKLENAEIGIMFTIYETRGSYSRPSSPMDLSIMKLNTTVLRVRYYSMLVQNPHPNLLMA